MKNELVSIIVPVYNVEKYIDQCLNNIVNQTYRNIEIIIINDGSTDNSYNICKKYASQDPRVILLSQENKGVSYARNKGILCSHGEYITFVDSDDYIELNYIECLINAIEENIDLVSICFNSRNDYPPGLITNQVQMAKLFTAFGYTWGKLIRRKCIKELFNVQLSFAEDFIFYISLLKNLRSVLIINYNGYHYRIRIGSLTGKDKNESHTINEFNRKYEFIMFSAKNAKDFRLYSLKTQRVINSHIYYICCLLILLHCKLIKSNVFIEKEKCNFILKYMHQSYRDFFSIEGIENKNLKRVLFGSALLISPNYGAMITEKILNKRNGVSKYAI